MKRSAVAALGVTIYAAHAAAFCGFYVKQRPGEEPKNPATSVILMRSGRTTVLAMQNDYEGPVEDFAMVVPVPTAIDRDNVRTLPRDVFAKVEELSSPRLVEYWEEEPWCNDGSSGMLLGSIGYGSGSGSAMVEVHARFEVGEYDVVVLSSSDSMALETWLTGEGYRIPAGASALLRPYIEAGSHFFVAKVDAHRVTFEHGRARLSPLRIHYQSDTFSLPVRLGLANSGGTQDLLVHILADARYEVANYPNVFIPTNIRVRNATKGRFGAFYAALFDQTLARHEGAVVTEYAWNAASCDPCPGPVLDATDLLTLGGDVASPSSGSMTLTRLHYRYDRDGLRDDLVFRPALPATGGTGMPDDRRGRLDGRVVVDASGSNQFQARYVVLHNRARDASACPAPGQWVRSWGGPPSGREDVTPALDLSRAPRRRPIEIDRLILDRIPALDLRPRRSSLMDSGSPSATARMVVDDRGFLALR